MRGTTNREAPTDHLPVLICLKYFEKETYFLVFFSLSFRVKNLGKETTPFSPFLLFASLLFFAAKLWLNLRVPKVHPE